MSTKNQKEKPPKATRKIQENAITKNVEALQEQLASVADRLEQNAALVTITKERLSKAEKRKNALTGLIEQAHQERQKALAEGTDHKDLTLKIKQYEEEDEILTEEITGLQTNLSFLNLEKQSLEGEQLKTRKDLVKEEIRPLVARYNKVARQLADILASLEEAVWAYNVIRVPGSEDKMPVYSSGPYEARGWDDNALSSIPSLFMLGEEASEVIYDRRVIIEGFKKKMFDAEDKERKSREKQDVERRFQIRKELEEKYKDADCLKCSHYLGVPSGANSLMCESFFNIPTEILEVKISHRYRRIDEEPFLFEEKIQ